MKALKEDFSSFQTSKNEETAGSLLSSVRRTHNIQVQEVSDYLRLSPWQIEALESDQYERLSGPTFVKGIIRNYAKALEIDPEPILQAYARVSGQREAAPTIEVPTQNIRFKVNSQNGLDFFFKAGLTVFALLIIMGSTWMWYTKPANQSSLASARNKENSKISLFQSRQERERKNTESANATASTSTPIAEAAKPAVAPIPSGKVIAAPTIANVVPHQPVTNKTNVAAAVSNEQILRLKFKGQSWVDIKDAEGNILLHQLNPPGTEKALNGKPPFSLVIGNARSVTLAYNDKEVDLNPYIKVHVARLRLE